MRKIYLLIAILFCIGISDIYAQNDYTSYGLSNTAFQEGTARSMAMGNALNALGGDIGAINFNPAGTGIYKFTEMSITPALSTVSTTSDFFGSSYKTNRTTFGIANTGAVFYIPTGSRSGLKNINFGVVFSKLNNYNMSEIAKNRGNVSDPTFLDHLANYTNESAHNMGYNAEDFADIMNINSSQNPYRDLGGGLWPSILGWNTSLLNLNAAGTAFEPTSQGAIDQQFKRKSFGYNAATDFSFAMNFSDVAYIGLNTTFTSVYNKIEESYSEDSTEPHDFNYMDHFYDQKTIGSGIGGKLGVIIVATPNIRFGASISTPTMYYLTDKARWGMNSSLGTDYTASLRTPRLEMDYRVKTPFKYNLGASVVFPQFALSFDYEGTDMSQMRFLSDETENFDSRYDWSYINDAIKESYERQDKVRIGFEYNLPNGIAWRLGYQYSNSGIKSIKIDSHIISAGVGYSAPSGFFADLAYVGTTKKSDVLFDGDDLMSSYIVQSSTKEYKRNVWKLLATVGFRF